MTKRTQSEAGKVLGRKGGKARWAGQSPAERSRAMRELVAKRWAKTRGPTQSISTVSGPLPLTGRITIPAMGARERWMKKPPRP